MSPQAVSESPSQETRRRRTIFLLLLLAVSTAVRLFLGHRYFGFASGDDVEILEIGFRRVLGVESALLEVRNPLVGDLLVAPALALADAVGIEAIRTLTWVATFPFVALATLNVALVYALGRRWLAHGEAALLAAALYAFHWVPLGYGSTVYPRTAATTCVLAAAWLLSRPTRTPWRPALAGAVAALAFAVRYSEGLYLLPLLALVGLWSRRAGERLRAAAAVAAGFGLTVLATSGLGEWFYWGRPFAGFAKLWRFAIVESQTTASQGNEVWWWYLRRLPKWLPLTLLPFFVAGSRRGVPRAALSFLVIPLLVLSSLAGKQVRFLQAVIPFVCLAAAGGAAAWWAAGRRRSGAALVALSLLVGLNGLTFLQKKSMAAVVAAEVLADDPQATCVALAQPWAYGNLLFLPPSTELRGLPFEPTVADLDRVVGTCPRLGLYAEHVEASPELTAWLDRRGFRPLASYRHGRSRAVRLFARSVGLGQSQQTRATAAPGSQGIALGFRSPWTDVRRPSGRMHQV